MRQYNFLVRSSSFFIFTLLFLFHCSPKESKDELILGKWDAHWETKPDENLPNLIGDNLKMNGVINFMADGKVEISAYGFQGCIFSDDTLKNLLNWKIEDSVLRFIDVDDEHGLPYNITKFNNRELQLTLLEDINLTLSRN